MKLINFLLISIFVFSCSPYKGLQNKHPKNDKEFLILAEKCSEFFPVKESSSEEVRIDTVIDHSAAEHLSDLLALVMSDLDHCKNNKGEIISSEKIIDSLKSVIQSNKPNQIVKEKIVTKVVKDVAQEEAFRIKIKQLEEKETILKNQIIEEKERVVEQKNARNNWRNSFFVLAFVFVSCIFLRLKNIL